MGGLLTYMYLGFRMYLLESWDLDLQSEVAYGTTPSSFAMLSFINQLYAGECTRDWWVSFAGQCLCVYVVACRCICKVWPRPIIVKPRTRPKTQACFPRAHGGCGAAAHRARVACVIVVLLVSEPCQPKKYILTFNMILWLGNLPKFETDAYAYNISLRSSPPNINLPRTVKVSSSICVDFDITNRGMFWYFVLLELDTVQLVLFVRGAQFPEDYTCLIFRLKHDVV